MPRNSDPSAQTSPSESRFSLIDTRVLSLSDLEALFCRADHFAKLASLNQNFSSGGSPRVIAGLFLEPSTRTRMSFQVAAQRLGHRTVVLDGDRSSSMAKGESDVDTVLNIAAMKPDAMIIRSNHSPKLEALLPQLAIPVVSAGSGTHFHPTQALLDAYTMLRERSPTGLSLKGERVLIVGDILHSRVANSNFDVLTRLGAEVAICGPPELLPNSAQLPGIQVFHDLDAALSWPTFYMGLRIQLERHDQSQPDRRLELGQEFHRSYGLTVERLQKLPAAARILHPGPINHDVEFCPAVVHDPRSRILQQVTNGVLVRASVLEKALNQSKAGLAITDGGQNGAQ